jgi:hypothetical protein
MDGWVDEMDDGSSSVIRIPWLAWHVFLPVSRGKALPARGVYEWMEWMYGRE